MNKRDTTIYSNYHEKSIIEHHGPKYGVTARVTYNTFSKSDGDGITTPHENWYKYEFQIESLEISDIDGNDLDLNNKSMKSIIQEIEDEILDFCKDNTDKFNA